MTPEEERAETVADRLFPVPKIHEDTLKSLGFTLAEWKKRYRELTAVQPDWWHKGRIGDLMRKPPGAAGRREAQSEERTNNQDMRRLR